MKQSNFLSLGWRDLARAFATAAIAFILQFLQDTLIPSLNLPIGVKTMIITGIAYLSKNLFTKPDSARGIVGDRPKDRD